MTTYDSPLRRELAEQTRERVLEALCAELAHGGENFSIPRVAKRAGVSVRTVYHHFPNREAQVEALATWIEKRVGPDELPAGPNDLSDYARRRVEQFFEHEALFRAQLAAGIASDVRARRRKQREAAMDACVAELGADPDATQISSALVKHFISGRIGMALLDGAKLSPDQCKRAQAWAVKLVVDALARGERP